MYDENNGKTKKGPTRLPQSVLQIERVQFRTFKLQTHHQPLQKQKLKIFDYPYRNHLIIPNFKENNSFCKKSICNYFCQIESPSRKKIPGSLKLVESNVINITVC